jgi:hypothetical protein
VSNENEGATFAGALEQGMQFFGNALESAGRWTRVAPCLTGPVVAADARHLCYTRLHERPSEREVGEAVQQDDRWRSAAGAVKVEPIPADIDEAPRRRGSGRYGPTLSEEARRLYQYERHQQRRYSATAPNGEDVYLGAKESGAHVRLRDQ